MSDITVRVDNTNFIQKLDTAHITITSPSGKSIIIRRTSISRFTPEQIRLFWKFCGDPMTKRVDFDVQTTKEEMQKLLIMSKM